jgi:hypothetical protein
VTARVRELAYDTAGRLVTESITDDFTGKSLMTTWDGLDAYGNAATTEGLLNGASLSAWTAAYDDQGRLTSRTTAVESVPVGTLSWTWNDDDTLSAVTTPSGAALSVHYTTSGPQRLLSEVRLDGATVAQILRRDGNLHADGVHFGGGRQLHSLRYDRMGHLDKRWTSTSTALNAPALTWEGETDDRGRLVAEHVTTSSTTDTSTEPGWLTDEQHTRGGAD